MKTSGGWGPDRTGGGKLDTTKCMSLCSIALPWDGSISYQYRHVCNRWCANVVDFNQATS